jgi:CubicO group peptidase (beta-lactamase class C family)
VTSPFERLTRKMPAIEVATIVDDRTDVTGYGTIASVAGSHWEIGSITKVFTGILFADMCEHGEVGLEDPIGRWVPAEVAERLPDHQPTLRQLATHTSGLPRLPKGWMRRIKGPDPYSQLSLQDVWDALGPQTLAPSKERFRYSNFGMGLLGHLLSEPPTRHTTSWCGPASPTHWGWLARVLEQGIRSRASRGASRPRRGPSARSGRPGRSARPSTT